MEGGLHTYGTFYVYALIVICGVPIIYKVLPETRNVSLEVIKMYFIQKTIMNVAGLGLDNGDVDDTIQEEDETETDLDE
jgi:hypothetical protein